MRSGRSSSAVVSAHFAHSINVDTGEYIAETTCWQRCTDGEGGCFHSSVLAVVRQRSAPSWWMNRVGSV